MNTNHILLTILAISLLATQPMLAAEQTKKKQISILKREWRALKDAYRCAKRNGIRKCSRAQKARIIAAGIALAVAISASVYVGIQQLPLTLAQQAGLNGNLAIAISSGHTMEAINLIGKGAAINTPIAGLTPLHQAVTHNQIAITNFLIEKGANINTRTNNHLTALDLVTNTLIQASLLGHGAKTDAQLQEEGR